uniref:G-protein coupled receptors family 1 profile domain-containing protein n=1 Tax=Plectus sambesii TaxID=2011161 RepID=A0A914XLJ2_9BILA
MIAVAFQFFLLAVALISLPIYIIFLYVLIKYRKSEDIKSSYFQLCFALGVADCYVLIHSHLAQKAAYWGIWREEFFLKYQEVGFVPGYLAWAMRAMTFAQFNGVLLLATNRFTAICLPFCHAKLWSTKIMAVAIFLQFAIPAVIVLPYFWLVVCRPIDSVSVSISFADRSWHRFYYFFGAIYMAVICFLCVLMYAAMLVQARLWRSKVIDSRQERRKRRMELKLALSAFAIFIPAFAYSCVMYNASTTADYNRLFISWSAASDVFAYTNVYVLLAISPSVRCKFLHTIGLYTGELECDSRRREHISTFECSPKLSVNYSQRLPTLALCDELMSTAV